MKDNPSPCPLQSPSFCLLLHSQSPRGRTLGLIPQLEAVKTPEPREDSDPCRLLLLPSPRLRPLFKGEAPGALPQLPRQVPVRIQGRLAILNPGVPWKIPRAYPTFPSSPPWLRREIPLGSSWIMEQVRRYNV